MYYKALLYTHINGEAHFYLTDKNYTNLNELWHDLYAGGGLAYSQSVCIGVYDEDQPVDFTIDFITNVSEKDDFTWYPSIQQIKDYMASINVECHITRNTVIKYKMS
jgi:hypothetical protein